MALDEQYLTQQELLLRDAERDAAQRKADWLEQMLVESIEAEEAHWHGVFRQSACHYSGRQHWE